ncbi:MAG: hypothetical protein R2941_12495 [Desulfobacterales bacterium]
MSKCLYILSVLMILGLPVFPAMADDTPLAMIIDAKGEVAYSPDGAAWKPVNRNKFLFEGWRVKTGEGSVCKLLKHQSEMIEVLAGGTEVEMEAAQTKVLSGNISDTRPARSFGAFLKRRFASVQKYTVTRSLKPARDIRLKTAREITLSEDYPDLVWDNPGSEYSYQLFVGDKMFEIPGTHKDMVRFPVPGPFPGENSYCVNVLYKGEVLYAPADRNVLKWLSDEEKKAFHQELARILEIAPDNEFLMGVFMEEKGFRVVAMDRYRNFLEENPDADEVKPFLLRVLGDLELEKLKKAEMAGLHDRQK